MNRYISATLVASLLVVLLLAGCGGGGGGSKKADSPLDNALGYVPKGGGFAIAFDTDVDGSQAKAVTAIVEKFPFAGALKSGFDDQLAKQKFSFTKDVKPLLGNEFVVGSTSAKSVVDDRDDNDFVAAIQLRNKDKFAALIKKSKSKKIGEHADATLYEDAKDNDIFALGDDGETFVVAGSRALLEQALDRRKAGKGLDERDFGKGLTDLPKDALVRASGSVHALLAADPDSAQARKVKWVDALTDFGVTLSATNDALALDFRLGTDGGDLSEADLPIATGSESPAVIQKDGEIGFGMRDIGQLVKFYESAAQTADPSGYARYRDGKKVLESQLGIDIDKDVLAQLKGDTTSSTTINGKTGLRATLVDPTAFRKTLAKLGKVVPKLVERKTGKPVGFSKPKGKDGYYALSSGGNTLIYGVVGDHFVAATDSASVAGLSAQDPRPVDGAEGSLAMKANARQVASLAISRFGAALGAQGALGSALFTGPLGDLTAWASADKEALKGQLKLGFN